MRSKNENNLIPEETGLLISVVEKIVSQHAEQGIRSPINNSLIADIGYRIREARIKHNEGEKYRKLMEDAFQDRDAYLGLSRAEDNLRNVLCDIISLLDDHYDDQPDELIKWGLRR